MIVRLASELCERIHGHAQIAYPNECCGLLVGRRMPDGIEITDVHKSANLTTGDPARSFEVDPKLRFDLMRATEIANDGTEIVGHYHSHPDHPAEPSGTDLEMAYEPHFVWLIVGAGAAKAGPLGAFRPRTDGSGFDALTLEVS